MLRKTILEQVSASSFVAGDLLATRRLALLAPLFAGLPLAASSSAAKASKLDPAETIIALPDAIRFIPWSGAPAQSLSLVLSGTWWVNSGADFDPNQTVPVPAGGFVRRVAHTPHYDGVKRDANEPAVIALFGIAPVDLTLVDPSKPGWRQV